MNISDMRSAVLAALMVLEDKGIESHAPVMQNIEKLLIQIDVIESDKIQEVAK